MSASASDYELVAPDTLSEVLSLLDRNWRPLAGGTDLMVLLEAGRLPFRNLVSLHRLRELQQIEVTDTFVAIGSSVTYTMIRNHPVLRREFELLCLSATWTGGIANQNRGTLGGNIVNASPAADSPPMLFIYDAELEFTSLRGSHRLSYESFHTGYKRMRMEPDELLTRILLPRRATPSISYARKVGARKAMAISKVSMGALASMDENRIADVRIAVGSVAPFPLRCRNTEAVLLGSTLSPEVRDHAAAALSAEIAPIDDIRSSSDYRRRVTLNLLSEFLHLLQFTDPFASWNHAPLDQAVCGLLNCCESSAWARKLSAARPFVDREQLSREADRLWWELSPDDWLEAFSHHPEIGCATSHDREAREQSGMETADDDLRQTITRANREYRARFGFIYIICAARKTATEMLANLQQRLGNDRETELHEAAEQQRQITQLRLRKWLNG